MGNSFNLAEIGRTWLSPEIIAAGLAMMLFSFSIVQPENTPPQPNTLRRQSIIDSADFIQEAQKMEPEKLAEAGKTDLAIRKAYDLAQLRPHDVLANLAAGNLFLKLSDKNEGFRLLRRSVALAPNSRFVRLNFADKLAENKHYDEAIAQYSLISQSYPRWTMPRKAMAQIYMVTDQSSSAVTELRQALSCEPNNGPLRKLLGIALAESGQTRKGLDEYVTGNNTELAEGPPSDVKQLIATYGTPERAIFELQQQLKIHGDDPNLKFPLARIYMYEGQINDAKNMLVDARRKASSNPQIHLNLAVILQKQGDTPAALSEFMLSLKLEKARIQAQHELSD